MASSGVSARFSGALAVGLLGMALPYLARLAGVAHHGWAWFEYTNGGPLEVLFIEIFNAFALGAILLFGAAIQTPELMLAPVVTGFGYLWWAHQNLNLSETSTAAIALVFIPFFAIPYVAAGGICGVVVDGLVRSGRLAPRAETIPYTGILALALAFVAAGNEIVGTWRRGPFYSSVRGGVLVVGAGVLAVSSVAMAFRSKGVAVWTWSVIGALVSAMLLAFALANSS